MVLEAFNAGCNIVAFIKNNQKYGMCCSWAQMVDYDKISLLLGAQSDTGKMMELSDIVGVSALASDQKEIALMLGSGHSSKIDKFTKVSFTVQDNAILINDAKVQMKCRVRQIVRLNGLEQDRLVIFDVLDFKQNKNRDFLSAYEI